jgi:hypothetical protein
MNNIIMQDVCETYAKSLGTDGKVYFLGLTSATDIDQTVKQTEIKGGIGNGVIAMIQSEKSIKFKVSTAIHSDSTYEMQSGTVATSGTYTVQKTDTDILTGGSLTITGTPTGSTAIVIDAKGKQFSGTVALKEVTITGGVEGNRYTILYSEAVTGDILDLRSDKFPNNYYVELHTIAYDADTNAVVADVYWTFNKALPDGSLSAKLTAGTNATDDINFTAQLLANSKSYGKYIVVPRA